MTSITKELPPLPPDDPDASYSADQAQTATATQPQPPKHTGLFKRLTTKLRKPSESWSADGLDASGKPRRPSAAHAQGHTCPNLENSFTSPEQRIAALRARGLLPAQAQPFKDAHGFRLPLSEQEQLLDRRQAVTVESRGRGDQETEAEKIAEAWMKKNMGGAYRPRSHSRESARSSGEAQAQPQGEQQQRPRGPTSPTSPSRPAFLQREPQASKLLDAMKNYRPPPGRPTAAPRPRRYPNDTESSTDSDSD